MTQRRGWYALAHLFICWLVATSLVAFSNPTAAAPGIVPIGAVQGVVEDTDDGTAHRSPFAPPSGGRPGETVTVQGVIYQKTLARSGTGGSLYGFFIQNTAETADGNPQSSDGMFVFHGSFKTLRRDGGGLYTPQVGDEVVLRGPVVEFFNLTQLSNPFLLEVVRSGVELDQAVPAFVIDPPGDLDEANRYWERREGMRAHLPAGSLAISGRDVFGSTLDGEVWAIHGDHPVAQRSDPYARRVFRDPHPLDNKPDQRFDDGNGYRIVLGSLGLKATTDDNTALIAPARAFDTITNAPSGGVYFSFGKYQVQVAQQLQLENGPDPSRNAPPQSFDRKREHSVVTFNVENLYDYRDNPASGCDFPGDPGCEGVDPPYDYVPDSDAAYQARLRELARQIVEDLHAPDIIMAQEAENQDICSVVELRFECGDTDGADGKPDTLQELSVVIAKLGGPRYTAIFDRDGADDRGIVQAFMYRADRVELLPASADDPVLGSDPQIDYRAPDAGFNSDVQNPKALNAQLPDDVDTSTGVDGDNVFSRGPQVGLFRVWRDGVGASVFTDLYLVNNHFSSGPNSRVGQRTEQANYNAAIMEALETVDEDVRIVVGGDLNVFPRPDDPFAPGDPRFPSDQLGALYAQGLINLYDVLVEEVPASAYTYVFQGQAQTLDQLFVDAKLRSELTRVRVAHINADWPRNDDGYDGRAASDHDPVRARYLNLPTFERLIDLIRYYGDGEQITGRNTEEQLVKRIERAQQRKDAGQHRACAADIQAFQRQVRGFAPRFVAPPAAAALVGETELFLAEQGCGR